MASIDQQPRGRPDSGLSYVPVAWLIIVMGLSAYGLISNWRLIGDFNLPESVSFLIYSGLAGGVVTILWGLYLLGLAFNRSARFPRHYTIWQGAIILWLVLRQAYTLMVPDFVFSAEALGFTIAEIAIGLLCIYLLRRGAGAEAVYANPETERPSLLVSLLAALLGIIVGGAIGACAGFFAGSLIADATHMSCFEGACGFFAVFVGLAGLVVGAIAGAIFAVWRVNRRKTAPAA
ncbi:MULTISPECIES: hypothetical protein [unclassified Mesorhizobium]|uniref:hypothetical protein n=1 Tax=unclassified Mesorhizobium TaxID=325217 RepID=UPI000BAEC13F|nr:MULTISPECIES: hypothetical protein [unclassified Mesorhizobium]TGT56516.1 hypothetical protein EN813_041880 [Mesorhizobium sp. M00.F.Ca.ET.170.01.1.1]AZO11574.1 hypothetical protein EJ074_22605 [Mesorhizobium sp. M3A.F.Ca.ET.080.04.2.1]PBB86803.1 hypothetical protein CK216_11110 [Mesorhizobium sp. WSM3876]RWB72790.1 MAG: hypothetical protein EOQ49_12580 [Mesorhizobium sp.]RWB86936.1 MAG: hypothetical protein EOQ52_16810 [Mesorhizobium sp.]